MFKTSLLFLAAGVVLLFGANTFAQEGPTTWEIGVNYSLAHFIPALTDSRSHNLNGGGGSAVYYTPIKWLGLKMDLQGYGSKTSAIGIPVGTPSLPGGGTATVQGNLFTYMFGPVIKKRGKFEPFGEVLVGGAYTNLYGNLSSAAGVVGASPNNNAFALTSGVGLDIHINRAISIRPVEIGYLLTRFSNPFSGGAVSENSYRYIGGVTFNFGGGGS
jgi:hypothetical protein